MMDRVLACLRSIADGLLQPRKRPRLAEHEVDDLSESPVSQADKPLDLLGLPDSWLMNMISFLSPEDDLALFESSKACAKIVLSYYAQEERITRCRVSKSTSWKGLRQVLSWIQTPVCLAFERHAPTDYIGISAYDVFLSSAIVPSTLQQSICNKYRFPCVRSIDLSAWGIKIRSLVPRVIAATCPNLQSCCISVSRLDMDSQDNMEELRPCDSLTELEIHGKIAPHHPDQVPYHSINELVAAFPNINTLHFPNGTVVPFVMQAFSQQVTVLEITVENEAAAALLQPYCKLQNLILHGSLFNNLLPLSAVTEHLRVLELSVSITDSILEQLLQLPSLTELTVPYFNDLRRDFSNRSFNNQISLKLNGVVQDLRAFAKLPIRSVKQCLCNTADVDLMLPDPSDVACMASLRKMAKSIADTNLEVSFEKAITFWLPETHVSDAAAAELFIVVAKALTPCEQCDLVEVANYPAFQAAVLEWAAPALEHVHIMVSPETCQPYIWQLFQKMPFLSTISLSPGHKLDQMPDQERFIAQTCDAICCAAQNLVEPIMKPGDGITFLIEMINLHLTDEQVYTYIDIMIDMLGESLPDTSTFLWEGISGGDWQLTLRRQGAKPKVADQSNPTNM